MFPIWAGKSNKKDGLGALPVPSSGKYFNSNT